MTLRVAKIRAFLGIAFMLLGIAIAVHTLVQPGPKPMGLAFSVVLVALGFVRVRTYLKLKSELAP
jgi:hypothetical protein